MLPDPHAERHRARPRHAAQRPAGERRRRGRRRAAGAGAASASTTASTGGCLGRVAGEAPGPGAAVGAGIAAEGGGVARDQRRQRLALADLEALQPAEVEAGVAAGLGQPGGDRAAARRRRRRSRRRRTRSRAEVGDEVVAPVAVQVERRLRSPARIAGVPPSSRAQRRRLLGRLDQRRRRLGRGRQAASRRGQRDSRTRRTGISSPAGDLQPGDQAARRAARWRSAMRDLDRRVRPLALAPSPVRPLTTKRKLRPR